MSTANLLIVEESKVGMPIGVDVGVDGAAVLRISAELGGIKVSREVDTAPLRAALTGADCRGAVAVFTA